MASSAIAAEWSEPKVVMLSGVMAEELFPHGPRLTDHRGEIVHPFAAVVEADLQPEVVEFFEM
jgi:hypothetical protein